MIRKSFFMNGIFLGDFMPLGSSSIWKEAIRCQPQFEHPSTSWSSARLLSSHGSRSNTQWILVNCLPHFGQCASIKRLLSTDMVWLQPPFTSIADEHFDYRRNSS